MPQPPHPVPDKKKPTNPEKKNNPCQKVKNPYKMK